MHVLRKKPLWMVLNKMLHIYSFYLIVIPTMLNFTTFMKVFNLKFRLVNDFLESYVIRYDQTELEKKPRQPLDVILKDVVVVHSMLRNAIDEHNELYSVQILFFLATCFTNFNSNVFFFFFASPNKIQTIYCLYWSSMHFFILTMLLRETSNAKIEANSTARIIHQLLLSNVSDKVKNELQLFSLQLIHEKVNFTACGFFPLDLSVLFNTISSVVTYLIILIQLQISTQESSVFKVAMKNNATAATAQ
nr:PREDICTED: putative gustatory receptor 28b [Bemisia tabaci]